MEQETLFANQVEEPLANRVRPTNLDQFVGQQHLIGQGKILRELLENDQIPSMILWGPPGVGKTTLATLIARQTKARFLSFSAVNSSITKIKKVMNDAAQNLQMGTRTIVFVDEIHRFNKAQQDAFLPAVERGAIILIGATTENPSFEINSALLSRCKVFVLQPLDEQDIVKLLVNTINSPRAFHKQSIKITQTQLMQIAKFAAGDARKALNTMEMAVMNGQHKRSEVLITDEDLKQIINKRFILYDKKGEEHYNLISALHKSMRNSDVDAAIYWLSRMLDGGEDPLYIARRLVRFASEDVGLADPNSLNVAINVFQACQFLGMPECDVHLVEAVAYLALAPKSNSIYIARQAAADDVKKTPNEPVPLQIRNGTTNLMKKLGYGQGYQYAHDHADKLTTMETMPKELRGHTYYHPSDQGHEKAFKHRLEVIKQWHREHNQSNNK